MEGISGILSSLVNATNWWQQNF